MMHQIFYYVRVYKSIFRMALMNLLEYRFNAVVSSLYAFIFFFGLILVTEIVYVQTPELVGWNRVESLILVTYASVLWIGSEITFFNGFRSFTVSGYAKGQLDVVLTKPIGPQYLIGFGTPAVPEILHLFALIAYLTYQLSWVSITPLNLLLSLTASVAGISVFFFIISAYATLCFYFTKSSQILRAFYSVNDHGNYPTPVFPKIIQITLMTIVPIAFLGYIPTAILLGKISPWIWLHIVAMILITYLLQAWAWNIGLKHYSSASS